MLFVGSRKAVAGSYEVTYIGTGFALDITGLHVLLGARPDMGQDMPPDVTFDACAAVAQPTMCLGLGCTMASEADVAMKRVWGSLDAQKAPIWLVVWAVRHGVCGLCVHHLSINLPMYLACLAQLPNGMSSTLLGCEPSHGGQLR